LHAQLLFLTNGMQHLTLCHTCHKGLDPHENPALFNLVPAAAYSNQEYAASVKRYRERVYKEFVRAEREGQP